MVAIIAAQSRGEKGAIICVFSWHLWEILKIADLLLKLCSATTKHLWQGLPSLVYLQVIKVIQKSVKTEELGIKYNFTLSQDKDPKHKALFTRLWLLYNTPKCIETILYEPYRMFISFRQKNKEVTKNKNALKFVFLDRITFRIDATFTKSVVNPF